MKSTAHSFQNNQIHALRWHCICQIQIQPTEIKKSLFSKYNQFASLLVIQAIQGKNK